MQDFLEFFRGLLDYDRWPPRWKCGEWSNFHGWLYIASDLMIWIAYFLIPVLILNYFNTKKTAIRFQRVYLLFAAFILLCGTTHFLDAMMFWIPAYRLSAFVRFITGVASLLTVYHLVKILPQMVKLRTNVELEREITRREQVEKDLAEANTRLAAFASIASHDLQEPIRKINTFASMVYSHNVDRFDAVSRQNTEKIMQAAGRMQALINDVLVLSTMSDAVKLEPVDPAVAIRQAMEILELVIADTGAVVIVEPLPAVQGNLQYITQVFSNVISNAIKFNDNTPEIRISGHQKDGIVFLRISDNGIGFQSEYYEKIFQPFQRLHSKQKYGGTGIGLAICRRIMEIHQGNIEVESLPGKGSVFILTFPAASLV